jgi:hypothetical protein
MVHALLEAHRVLRPDGLLLDVRPAAAHRRIGLGEGRAWRTVGVMREPLDEDRRADRSVHQVVRRGLFRFAAREDVLLERVMDTMEDFHAWLEEFNQRRILTSHAWLIRRLERAGLARPAKIVARGPLAIRVLRKLDPTPRRVEPRAGT